MRESDLETFSRRRYWGTEPCDAIHLSHSKLADGKQAHVSPMHNSKFLEASSDQLDETNEIAIVLTLL